MNRFVRQPKRLSASSDTRRMTFVAAIIFLLLAGLIGRLAHLQIFQHDYYAALAQGAHAQSHTITPERGKIYAQGNYMAATAELYPIAINKDFATLFAIPRDIKDPAATAEKLFDHFKAEPVKKEIEDQLRRERFERLDAELVALADLPEEEREAHEISLRQEHETWVADPLYLELEQARRERLFKERREQEVAAYIDMLDRPKSQFRSLDRKLSFEDLKAFYIFISERTDLDPAQLEIRDGKMFTVADSPEELALPGFSFHIVPYRFYPEYNLGAHVLGFTNYETEEQRGRYGLEGFFDKDLFGSYGSVTMERGNAETIIVNNRQHLKKTDGASLVLTIDHSAQFMACRLLNEATARHGADGGSVIVVDPRTGAILAMCGSPDFDPNSYGASADIQVFNNPAIFNQYEPGSVFKAITMAAALDQGKVVPETTYVDQGQIMIPGWSRPIRNSDFARYGGHGVTTMVTVLEQSLNTGAIFAMQQVGPAVFADYVKKFGFGEKTGLELQGESEGDIRSITGKQVRDISAATASFGQGITVTPLQMVMSYAAIANGGKLAKPYIVKETITADGQRIPTPIAEPRRVISERTAALLTGMLINVVEEGHSKRIKIPGYYIAGKTGTAQVASASTRGYSGHYDHTFIGLVPADEPKFVILTQLSKPRSAIYAESTVVPLAHDITRFLLNHWQIKPDRPIE